VAPTAGRIRRPGAGRKALAVSDPRLVDAVEEMIAGATRALSMWEPTTTPERLPWLPFADGGALRDGGWIRGRPRL
jgi:hypothetical protein